jgi:hypothetical protein
MPASASQPYVSIVLTGRNDGHDGDFLRRFFAALLFNHRELVARAIPHEFVLVEWAPLPQAPLLVDLVEARCPAALVEDFRTLIVDPAYHEAMTLNPRLVYHQFLAKNVGVRRARGEYVISTNCDVIFGRQVLQSVERRALEPAVVHRAARWDLKATIDIDRLDWTCLEDPANLARPGKRLRPPYFRGSSGDFIALDRDTFHRLGGFNEIYRVSRFGIDANLLIHALSAGLRIVDIGGPVYHVHHDRTYQTAKAQEGGAGLYGDEHWPCSDVVYRNPVTWGLADAPARVVGRRTYLDFSWAAVPALVDLAGVVLPARRAADAGDPARFR